MTVVSMSFLLESGVHFGHQTKRWNPKMREYIFTSRDDIYIIDLQKTAAKIEEAYVALKNIIEQGGDILFVGTKKQVQETTKEAAERAGMPYVDFRWLGGTLTNHNTIKKRIKRLEEIEAMEKDGTFEALPKKEVAGLKKEYEKLSNYLTGIRNMEKLPKAIFVVDTMKDEIAIKEAKKLGIKVFGIVDTNCDPDLVDYIIPANDDAIRAVKLILGVMANAVVEVKGGTLINYVTEEDKASDKKEAVKEAAPKKEPKEEKPEVKEEEKIEEPKNEEVVEEKPKKTPKKEPKKEKVDLSTLKVAELKELAKEKEVAGYSKMKKDELIKALS